MIRSTLTKRISDYLASVYDGPVAILTETDDGETQPPYAVIRCGSAESLYPGQAEVWDINILVGVFHDADLTTAPNAEAGAAAVFLCLEDAESLQAFCSDVLAFSAWERMTTEMSIAETNWQHVAGFRAIVSPMN
jgi:hypothetical protein